MTRRRVSPTARAGVPSDVRVAVLATSAERARWAARAAEAGLTLSEVARAAWDAMPPTRAELRAAAKKAEMARVSDGS